MLVRSRTLAWGIRIVNRITDDEMTAHRTRASFERARRAACGVRLNAGRSQGSAPLQLTPPFSALRRVGLDVRLHLGQRLRVFAEALLGLCE